MQALLAVSYRIDSLEMHGQSYLWASAVSYRIDSLEISTKNKVKYDYYWWDVIRSGAFRKLFKIYLNMGVSCDGFA